LSEPCCEGRITIDFSVAIRSDIGNHHPVNQDAGGAWVFSRGTGTAALLVVADGVSAGQHSEEASRLTVELVHEHMAPVLSDPGADLPRCGKALVDAIAEANRQIAQRPYAAVTSADSTTVVATVALGDGVVGAWVGDSRVYRVRSQEVTQLSVDHSWAEGVVSRGLMSPEQAAADPRAHVIMRWLGPPEDRDPGIETFETGLGDGDVLLCCTDGLYMYFAPPSGSEDEVARTLSEHQDLEAALAALVRTALRRGGYDNITVAALRARGRRPADRPTEEIPIVRTDSSSPR
jgi:serine/threonine protein phosphatase PrpC